MPPIVVLTGGGIKGAVAAGRCAREGDVVLVHVDYGQPSAPAEVHSVRALAQTLPSATVLPLCMPHVAQIQDGPIDPRVSTSAIDGSHRLGAVSLPLLRGMMGTLLATGVQCAMRVGSSSVVLGVSRFCDASHLGLPSAGSFAHGWHEFIHSAGVFAESLAPGASAVRIDAPLLDMSLSEVIKLGGRFAVQLEHTRSCSLSGLAPCGHCAPCTLREASFVEAGMVDPLTTPASASD